MRSQKNGLAFTLVLGVSLLFLSTPGCQGSERAAAQPQALLDLMKGSVDVPDDAKVSLANQIVSDVYTIGQLFKAKEFHSLARLMGKRGMSLITTGFDKVHGAGSAEHWQSLWREGGELKLVPVNIYLRALKDHPPVPYSAVMDQGVTFDQWREKADYYDAVAVVTVEYEITGQTAPGSAGDVEDPPGTMILLHKSGCPWG